MEGKGHGVAMHDSAVLIKGLYYGFNEHSLFLRVDIDRSFIRDIEDLSFEIGLNVEMGLTVKQTFEASYSVKGNIVKSTFPVEIVFSEVLEVATRFEFLGVKAGDKIGVWITLKTKEMMVGRIPVRGYLMITVPSETFEMEMWYV